MIMGLQTTDVVEGTGAETESRGVLSSVNILIMGSLSMLGI